METVNLVETLAQLGVLGAVIIGFGGAYFIMRREKKNGNGTAQALLDTFLQNQASMVEHQARLADGQKHIVDAVAHVQEGMNRLVELHIRMEERTKVLDNLTRGEGEK